MASSINERFLDFQIAQQVRWIRFQNREVREALKILMRVDADLKAALEGARIGEGTFTEARLNALRVQITNLINAIHMQVTASVTTAVKEASIAAAEVEQQAFTRILPAGLDVTTPNLGVLQTAASLRPFNGGVLADWTDQLRIADLQRTWRTILDGITSGTTTEDLVSSLIGTRSLRYKDGVREVTRRGLETLVRTSINHATNQGRQMVWEANTDLLKGVRWVSTLDSRTTPICQERDGKVGPVVEDPNWSPPQGADRLDPPMARPPAHPNCRSTTVAVTKSWRELGFDIDELPEGTRASMDGQVPSSMTYYDWLKRQSEGVQRDVLGPARFDMWKNDGVLPERFVNDQGRLLTLKELRAASRVPDTKVVFTEGGIDWVENPLRHYSKRVTTSYESMRENDSSAWQSFYDKTIDLERVEAGTFEVKLSDLRTFQSIVAAPNEGFTASTKPIFVLRYQGRLYLKDGNHRAVAALRSGNDTVLARIVDLR